ncbi:hypothetical protein [Encephalitozoon cuniculi GB-M1]|uniref:Uncharacterized protein n=1 Tax=Encephalitozoon cuniculi (strain GB-M1) TaxID=284813 RepID=Q8ST71_ENCCU|nr:hypothetical protein [Encephalitozoon cuniculi GB-M1]CAD25030.1 hypothetical protein [Encephalitozoon cuniculi GB-M1]
MEEDSDILRLCICASVCGELLLHCVFCPFCFPARLLLLCCSFSARLLLLCCSFSARLLLLCCIQLLCPSSSALLFLLCCIRLLCPSSSALLFLLCCIRLLCPSSSALLFLLCCIRLLCPSSSASSAPSALLFLPCRAPSRRGLRLLRGELSCPLLPVREPCCVCLKSLRLLLFRSPPPFVAMPLLCACMCSYVLCPAATLSTSRRPPLLPRQRPFLLLPSPACRTSSRRHH